MEWRKKMSDYVDGVDTSPEGIEEIRNGLIEHRNQMLMGGVMELAVLASHAIVMLAELKKIKEQVR